MASAFKGDKAARRCIEKYLAEVNDALRRAGVSRSEMENVVADVRAQILEMLAVRTSGEPTLQDAEAVIAELDPPETYASEMRDSEQERPGPRRFSRHALWGAIVPVVGYHKGVCRAVLGSSCG